MAAVTRHALETVRGASFTSPPELLATVLPEACRYAREITGRTDLRLTFVLNALVPFDNASASTGVVSTLSTRLLLVSAT